jgi:hypothetical protein
MHQRADNTARYGVALSPRMPEGKDHLANARRNGSRLERSQTGRVDGEQGQIHIGIACNEARFIFSIILQDNDWMMPSNHVIVREDQSIRIPDDPRASAEAMTAHDHQSRHHLLDEVADHLCKRTIEIHVISHRPGHSRFEAGRRAKFRSA